MTLYPLRPLADLCERVTDGTHQPPKFTSSGIPFLFVSNIVNGQISFATTKFIAPDTHCELNRRCPVEVGDVIVSTVGSYGNAAVVHDDRPFSFQRHIAHIKLKTNLLDAVYLVHALHSAFVRAQIDKSVRGVAQKTLNLSELKKLQIPAPAINEQRRIADVLDRAETLRAKRRAALAELDGLAQSIFIEMFGDPVINMKNWPLQALGSLGTLDRGISKHRPRNAPELLGGPYPLVQTGDIANCDGYVRNYHSTYSEIGLRQSRLWPSGTLCITIAANIAKSGILLMDACFPDSVVGFVTENRATVEFVRCWLSFVQKRLEESAPESAQKNINLFTLRNLTLPVPPIDLQEMFARRVAAVEKLKAVQRASLAELDALFASLQDRAFRGAL